MEIKENILLAPYTTFKIGGPAKFFCVTENEQDLRQAMEFAKKEKLQTLFMGGGSNMLVSDKGFDGLVIKVDLKGIETMQHGGNEVLLKAAAGENWDNFVKMTVENAWWGLENLSHIPGNTAAVAVQNVGAYGQEAKNVIEAVEVYDTQDGKIKVLKNKDCEFGYRSSIFNSREKGRYIILFITFRLLKNPQPILSYRDLKNKFDSVEPTQQEIRQAVIQIRNKKFPFPTEAKNGNAGSFFKNVILNSREYSQLLIKMELSLGKPASTALEQRKFLQTDGSIKIPTAFLLDVCGLKDLENGGAAINHSQPLVIINKTGNATAQDVLNLANKVRQTVLDKTGIQLELEPDLVGF